MCCAPSVQKKPHMCVHSSYYLPATFSKHPCKKIKYKREKHASFVKKTTTRKLFLVIFNVTKLEEKKYNIAQARIKITWRYKIYSNVRWQRRARDYFSTSLCLNSVINFRDRNNELKISLNTQRHNGMNMTLERTLHVCSFY